MAEHVQSSSFPLVTQRRGFWSVEGAVEPHMHVDTSVHTKIVQQFEINISQRKTAINLGSSSENPEKCQYVRDEATNQYSL